LFSLVSKKPFLPFYLKKRGLVFLNKKVSYVALLTRANEDSHGYQSTPLKQPMMPQRSMGGAYVDGMAGGGPVAAFGSGVGPGFGGRVVQDNRSPSIAGRKHIKKFEV